MLFPVLTYLQYVSALAKNEYFVNQATFAYDH